jgi:Transglycosylase
MQKRSKRAQARWERSLRSVPFEAELWGCTANSGMFRSSPHIGPAPQQWVQRLMAAARRLRGLALPTGAAFIPTFAMASPWKKLGVALGGLGAGLVMAAGMAVEGYATYDDAFWHRRIQERTQSPIFSDDGTLIGSVGLSNSTLSAAAAPDYAFVPFQGAAKLPATYEAALLWLENRNYRQGGIHNVCGLDLPSTAKRWLTSFNAGGSTINMQLARNLIRPDWAHEENRVQKLVRKFREIGAASASTSTSNLVVSKMRRSSFMPATPPPSPGWAARAELSLARGSFLIAHRQI